MSRLPYYGDINFAFSYVDNIGKYLEDFIHRGSGPGAVGSVLVCYTSHTSLLTSTEPVLNCRSRRENL